MVSRPNRNALLIQDRADIMRMDTLDDKGEYRRLVRGGPDQSNRGNRRQRLCGIVQQFTFVSGDRVHSDGQQVVDGGAESDASGDVGRPRLELEGKIIVGRPLKGNRQDHLPATLIGRHGIQEIVFAVQHADTGRTQHLMA